MCLDACSSHHLFCVSPLTVTQGALAYHNLQQNRVGAALYEEPVIAIRRINTQGSASAKRLDSWATHPDERVVIALLFHHQHRLSISDAQLSALARRATAGVVARGVLWTPLFDAVAHNVPYSVQRDAHLATFVILRRTNEEALARWVSSATSSQDLNALLTFRSPTIREQVAANGTCLDEQALTSLMGNTSYDRRLTENPSLSESAIALLIAHVFGTVTRMRSYVFNGREQYIVLLHKLTLRGGTLSLGNLVALLLRLPDLRTEIDWSGLWFSELGADAVYELLLEVTLTTARRRLPELCIHRNDLALLFQSPEERVREAALTWLAEGLITMDQSSAA